MCPPGTFVRSWDLRFDADKLNAMGLTCSDGTYAGGIGLWQGTNGSIVRAATDGFRAVNATIDGNGYVSSVCFLPRSSAYSSQYPSKPAVFRKTTTTCFLEERIIGIAARAADSTGRLGAFVLLCGTVSGERWAAKLHC